MENTQKDEEKNHNKLSVRLNLRLIKYNWSLYSFQTT